MAYDDPYGINANFQNLNNVIMSIGQMKRQSQDDELRSLQVQEMKRKLAEDQGLRARLSSMPERLAFAAQPANTPTSVFRQGDPSPLASLLSSAMSQQAPAFPQATGANTTSLPKDYAGEAAKYFQEQGNPERASEMLSLNDKLAEHAAKSQAYGDMETYYKTTETLKKMETSGALLKKYLAIDPTGQLAKEAVRQNRALFPNANPDTMGINGGVVTFPVDSNGVKGVSWFDPSEGKWHFEKSTSLSYKDREIPIEGGKRWQKEESYTGGAEGSWKPVGAPYEKRDIAFQQGNKDKEFTLKLYDDHEKRPEVQEYTKTASQMARIEKSFAASKKGGNMAAIDQGLITMYNKMIDPNSVVREGEYDRFEQMAPILNRLQGKVQRVSEGGAKFTDEERQALYDASREYYVAVKDLYDSAAAQDIEKAQRFGVNPKDVVSPRKTVEAPKKSALVVPPKSGARIPPGIAKQYMGKYGSAAAAREAAKNDGWSF